MCIMICIDRIKCAQNMWTQIDKKSGVYDVRDRYTYAAKHGIVNNCHYGHPNWRVLSCSICLDDFCNELMWAHATLSGHTDCTNFANIPVLFVGLPIYHW